ncbi:MAG: hypothetical protein JOZ39_06060 [Chloroflexi bacterium]|nr:hypothetical protein [Chloroflexota bacterium]
MSALFAGCHAGLFELSPNGGGAWNVRPVGLMGKAPHWVIVDCKDPQRLYVATGTSGVQRSDDGGKTWRGMNKGLLYRDVWCVAQNPRTGDIFAGTQPASIFKSVDGGETWEDFSSIRQLPETHFWTFPRPPHMAHVKDIQVSPNSDDLIIAAIEEGWLIRTKDAGKNWETLKQGVEFDAHAVTLFDNHPDVVIATPGTGVYKSVNGGDTFVKASEGIRGGFMGSYMSPVAVHKSRPKTLFAGAADVPPPFWFTRKEGANTGFYRSDDQGESWQRLTGGLPEVVPGAARSVAIEPNDPDTVYIGLTDGRVWQTRDGGTSWSQIAEGLKGWVSTLAVSPN